jgi:galactitol-specific phosphotransferase system IIB component
MKLKQVTIIIFILSTFCCYSQFKDYNNTIGFVCGGTGSSTPIVNRVYNLLEEKKYEEITSMLYSENPAENFLAVILCEKLKENGVLILSEKQEKRISKLYKSNKKVEVCGGCTFMGFVKLSLLLNNKDEDKTREEADEWLKDVL